MGDDKLNIGLRRGKVLCGMKYDDRLAFIGDGLPIVLESARGFWQASLQLQSSVREATVLRNHAVEEAGKILILMDIARCPEKIVARRIGPMKAQEAREAEIMLSIQENRYQGAYASKVQA